MVAVMTEALNLEEGDRVLEIGTGSAYQTAVLAALAREVFSIERLPRLLSEAERTLEEMGIANVRIRLGDGTLGWPEEAPFNAVLVTAGAPDIPPDLKSQLTPNGGRLVIPVGGRSVQNLLRITRDGEEYREEELLACRFVPLIGAKGWRSTDQR
jgi:protein-L-isoaspartate(D-aspartate) O-methyltransferase